MSTLIRSLIIVSVLVTFAASPALAADADLPYPTFTAGQTAKASEVTANFQELETAVNTKGEITAVNAGSYLSGGGTSGSVTLNVSGMPGVEYATIERTSLNVSNSTNLGSIVITHPASGYVVVRFDGYCYVDSGDELILAASDSSASWGVNSGHVSVYGSAGSGKHEYSFSHSRVYQVTGSGSKTFYAVADHWAGDDSITSVYATLTAQYYPVRY